MLPAWATVVLALGGAAIGALAGITASVFGYRGTELNVVHQESEAWRKVLIEACQALSDAWLELRWLLYPPSRGASAFDPEARARLDPLGTRCAQTVARVILLFGRESTAGKAANEVDLKVAELKDAALHAPWDEEATTRVAFAIRAAEQAHEEFLLKAQVAIRPPRWQAQGSDVGDASRHRNRLAAKLRLDRLTRRTRVGQ
jgi:hypothetical protein